MIAVPPEIAALAGSGLWHVFAVFLRVSAIVSLLPAFGEQNVPMRIKLGLAAAFTMIVAPAVEFAPPPPGLLPATGLIAAEVLTGLILGLGIRLFILGLQTAGSIAAQATSLSQILGGAAVEPIPAMGYVLVMGGLALAVMSGLHVRAAEFMIRSYALFPAGLMPDPAALSKWAVSHVGRIFSLAFSLAAPFVMASLIYNLTLGVINRAMPQLMVAFVGAPVITFGGLFLLFAGAPLILSVWHGALVDFLGNPAGALR